MPVVTPTNKSVEGLKGLHLYHGDISNCSMRVRMTLEEKNLPWISHHIDLRKRENISADYFGIHPKGLVPCLVHDGVVWTESNDIIAHIDADFPGPALRPKDPLGLAEMNYLLDLATRVHVPGVKTYMYAKVVAGKIRKNPEEVAKYKSLQKDPELLAFHAKHDTGGEFAEEDVNGAIHILNGCFHLLEQRLSARRWILGENFSLADIAWGPVHFTLVGAQFSFDDFPKVRAWADALRERQSFKKGVLEWIGDFSKI